MIIDPNELFGTPNAAPVAAMSKTEHEAAAEPPLQEVSRRDSKLVFISTPVSTGSSEKGQRVESMGLDYNGQADVEDLGLRYKDDHDCPEFVKHAASTNYELFYDLWFVANLEVFASSKSVSKEDDLYSYIGYLSILWFTWFLVGMFDVRFVTDSIFERIIRTAHLGVMVGFSVVVTYFDPENQEQGPFRTLSTILMISRLVLVFQYGTIIWHIRRFKHGKWPVAAAGAVHFVSAMIFLGIRFRFTEGRNSRVYVVWYIVSAVEAIIQLLLAHYYKVLTFSKTHLAERMTTLTVIILGSGVTSIAKNVVLIVKNAAGWTSATIGVLTSAIATSYAFFMIYFDWMDCHHLGDWRQLVWAMLHFPFHVALLLFMEGSTQFMIWWKVREVSGVAKDQFLTVIDRLGDSNQTITSSLVSQSLNDTVTDIFNVYAATYTLTLERATYLLDDIASLPETLWNSSLGDNPNLENEFEYDLVELLYTVQNSLFVNFNIDPFQDMAESDPEKMQDVAINDLNERYYTVFIYAFVTAGLVLMLMTIMYAVARKTQRWTPFIIFRTTLFGLMGLGLALVQLISRNEDESLHYLLTPWLLPTICIVFFFVLLVTHLPHPPPLFFSRRKSPSKSENKYNSAYVQVREVGVDRTTSYDYQHYDPRRWGTGTGTQVYMQDPTPEMTYHNAYGQSGDFGIASPPFKHD